MSNVEVPRRTTGCPVAHGALSAERTPTGTSGPARIIGTLAASS